MQDYQIIAALSEIKSEFKLRTKSEKSLQEIRIWFSFENDLLTVHDFSDHMINFVAGFYDRVKKSWHFTLDQEGFGRKFLDEQIEIQDLDLLASNLNEIYERLGFYPCL